MFRASTWQTTDNQLLTSLVFKGSVECWGLSLSKYWRWIFRVVFAVLSVTGVLISATCASPKTIPLNNSVKATTLFFHRVVKRGETDARIADWTNAKIRRVFENPPNLPPQSNPLLHHKFSIIFLIIGFYFPNIHAFRQIPNWNSSFPCCKGLP